MFYLCFMVKKDGNVMHSQCESRIRGFEWTPCVKNAENETSFSLGSVESLANPGGLPDSGSPCVSVSC